MGCSETTPIENSTGHLMTDWTPREQLEMRRQTGLCPYREIGRKGEKGNALLTVCEKQGCMCGLVSESLGSSPCLVWVGDLVLDSLCGLSFFLFQGK